MEPARWERIQEVFHGAAARGGPERLRYLETSCDGDPGLRAEVESLLAADARSSSLVDGGLAPLAGAALGAMPVPERIGPYTVLGILGEGGMGVVFRAERPGLGREVAVKVQRDAWLSPARRERFAVEQRILAGLDHPSIARLYDADVLPDGTPWFAMELVEGEPITAFCARRGSPLRERLSLFGAACEAVAFAQRHAVVHRDLKPGNVLVRADGTVKLLDFGIAKHLDAPPADATRTGLRLLTPAYAAPEQLRAEPPGLHTDVWALGVILYELLAGRRPFDAPGLTPGEAEAAVLSGDPERPSAAARAEGAAALAGRAAWADLDVLCLAALQKDPQRRYPSAEALLRDLERFLSGRPLEARPDSVRYRLGKLVGRHRGAFLAGALALLVLAGTALSFTVRLSRARDAALAESARAQHVQAFMQGLFEGGEKEAGPAAELRVLTVIDRGAREADALASEPATRADLLATLGALYQRLGRYDRAEALLARALERHRALRGDGDPVVAEDLVALGALRAEQDQVEEAEQLVRQGLALQRRALPPAHPALVRSLLALGNVQIARGTLEEARRTLEEAVALRSAPGTPPLDLAAALSRLAELEVQASRFPEADALNERALALYRGALGEKHPLVADRLSWLGESRLQIGKGDEAVAYDRAALEAFRAWYGDGHPRTAVALSDLGRALVTAKRYDEAEPLLREALAVVLRLHGERHATVADARFALANLVHKQGRHGEAAALCRSAREGYRAIHGERHYGTGMATNCEAVARLRLGEWEQAEALAREARAVLAAVLPADNPALSWPDGVIGLSLYRRGRLAEAEAPLRQRHEVVARMAGPRADGLDEIRAALVDVYRRAGRPEEAARYQAEQDAAAAPAAALAPR